MFSGYTAKNVQKYGGYASTTMHIYTRVNCFREARNPYTGCLINILAPLGSHELQASGRFLAYVRDGQPK